VTSDPFYAFIRFLRRNQQPVGVELERPTQPAVDALINDRLQTSTSPADALMARVHEKVVDDAVLIWVVHDTNPHALSPKISHTCRPSLVPGPETWV